MNQLTRIQSIQFDACCNVALQRRLRGELSPVQEILLPAPLHGFSYGTCRHGPRGLHRVLRIPLQLELGPVHDLRFHTGSD